jgi:predicted ATP-grasp superfamily ATP-dependent carboligase
VHVLIVGVSTRAAAYSSARAGYDVTSLDAYADLDQHPSVRALSLPKDCGAPFSPDAVVNAARDLRSDALVYLSSFENHPRAVQALTGERALWGNTPDVLRRVRDPQMLSRALWLRGICAPLVTTEAPPPGEEQWVIKPRVSGGGHGVRLWRPGATLRRGQYLQQFVAGVPGSVIFVAAGGRGVALGTSRQLVGESAFGVSGYRYCGNVMSASVDALEKAAALVDAGAADALGQRSLAAARKSGGRQSICRLGVAEFAKTHHRVTERIEPPRTRTTPSKAKIPRYSLASSAFLAVYFKDSELLRVQLRLTNESG